MPSFGKFPIILLFLIGYYFVALHIVTEYLPDVPKSKIAPDLDPFGMYIDDGTYNDESRWVSYGYYTAIPFFYIKRGIVEAPKLITVTSICDINLLYEAQNIALNYRAGPLSFAVYINQNHEQINTSKLHQIIHSFFINVSSLYDIKIGILAINTSSTFYMNTTKERGFNETSSLMFTIPTNALRNLAEHQITTDWLLNIDIDFWYLSETLNNNKNIKLLVEGLNAMINDTKYGINTVFVVPAFEVTKKTNETEDTFDYSMLTKNQLRDFVYLEEITPFHEGMHAHKCTEYNVWYKAAKPYKLNFEEVWCYWAYEPWFIMHKNTSTLPEYQWDNRYIGRGLNKVERVYRLRHLCFNFVVMHNLFMIHAPISHQDTVGDDQKKYNLRLFKKGLRQIRADPDTCAGMLDPPEENTENL